MNTYCLTDLTHATWPGLPKYRSIDSRQGYPTREAAEARIAYLERWAAAHYGARGGPDLRVIVRGK